MTSSFISEEQLDWVWNSSLYFLLNIVKTSFSEQSAIKHIGTPLGIICFFSLYVFEETSYKMYNTDWVGLDVIGSLLEGDTSQL